MFIPTLFIINKILKQPTCPSTGNRSTVAYTYDRILFPNLKKRNELLLHTIAWMNLKGFVSEERGCCSVRGSQLKQKV